MKIGIITLPLHTNYGGILQAYALQTVLERLGHEVEYIEVERKSYLLPFKVRYLVYIKRAIFNLFTKNKSRVFLESYNFKNKRIVERYTQHFINKYIHQRIISDYSIISKNDYDILMIGSDQIWRSSRACINNDYSQFLDFASDWNIRKLAYGCSFGEDEWRYTIDATNRAKGLLESFEAISVREDIGVQFCSEHFHVKANLVLDPTLLLDKSDYLDLLNNNSNISKEAHDTKGILCYILDESPDIIHLIDNISQEKGLTPFRVNSKVEDIMAPLEERIQPPVEEWLQGFNDAKMVITDSFHACVFSIIFNKPFICIGNRNRGMSRFRTLLSLTGLENRLLLDFDRIDNVVFEAPNVDYQSLRYNSLCFINNNI